MGEMATRSSQGLAVRDYLRVVGRWKWLIIAVIVACALAGYGYLKTRTPMYSATAELIYVQQVASSDPLGQAQVDPTLQQADIGSVPSVVGSDQVSAAAAQLLKNTNTSAGYTVSGQVSNDATSGNYSSVVGIEGVSSAPRLAATVANAYAQAFINWRLSEAQSQVGQEILAAQSALAGYTSAASKASASYQNLQQTLQTLQLEQKSATDDFSLLSPATAPSKPFAPRDELGVEGVDLRRGELLQLHRAQSWQDVALDVRHVRAIGRRADGVLDRRQPLLGEVVAQGQARARDVRPLVD
jgi:uncharacterized protein involved in exopolysaccharide biosynthesis